MRESYAIGDAENLRRVDGDAPHSINHFHGFQDSDKASSRPLAANPGFRDKFDEGARAAVQYGQLQVVNLHQDVIHVLSRKG
jgi:hypothetical protein